MTFLFQTYVDYLTNKYKDNPGIVQNVRVIASMAFTKASLEYCGLYPGFEDTFSPT